MVFERRFFHGEGGYPFLEPLWIEAARQFACIGTVGASAIGSQEGRSGARAEAASGQATSELRSRAR